MKHLSLTLILLFFISTAFSQVKPFMYKGERRKFAIYLPPSYDVKSKDQTFPLVLNYHGGGMTMTEQMFYSRMNETAEKQNFIVVYPQGLRQDWNVGFDMPYTLGTDDVGFTKALLDTLLKTYQIDKSRIYATGLSRGGFFCHRLAAELPEYFAAVASVGGPLPDSVQYFHKKNGPVGVMMIHGTEDEIVKYEGKEGAYRSAYQTYSYWKAHNGFNKEKEKVKRKDKKKLDSTSIEIKELWKQGIGVTLITVKGGGHTWPGSHPFNLGFPLGRTSQEIDINELIWDFFLKNKK